MGYPSCSGYTDLICTARVERSSSLTCRALISRLRDVYGSRSMGRPPLLLKSRKDHPQVNSGGDGQGTKYTDSLTSNYPPPNSLQGALPETRHAHGQCQIAVYCSPLVYGLVCQWVFAGTSAPLPRNPNVDPRTRSEAVVYTNLEVAMRPLTEPPWLSVSSVIQYGRYDVQGFTVR